MADGSFAAWLTSPAPPAWLAFIGGAVWLVKTWDVWKARISSVRASDDAIVGAQWKRFQDEIGRLVSRVADLEAKYKRLEESEERCRSELADAKGRIAELEGFNLGQGKAAQEAQGIVSAERLLRGDKK